MVTTVLADADITPGKLNQELAGLNLPGFIGTGRITRRKDENGDWQLVDPYVIVKADALSPAQIANVQAIIDAHVPEEVA